MSIYPSGEKTQYQPKPDDARDDQVLFYTDANTISDLIEGLTDSVNDVVTNVGNNATAISDNTTAISNNTTAIQENSDAIEALEGGVNIVNFSDVGGETIDLDNTTYNTIYISASSFESSLRLNVGSIGVGQVVILTSNPVAGASNIYFNATEARNENNLFSSNTLLVEQGKTVSILCLNATQFLIIGKVTNV